MNQHFEENTFNQELAQERLYFDDLAKKDIHALYDFYERHDIAELDCPLEERSANVEKLWGLVEANLKRRHGILD